MRTINRGFCFDRDAWQAFRDWCKANGTTPATTVREAITAYTGVHFRPMPLGRPKGGTQS